MKETKKVKLDNRKDTKQVSPRQAMKAWADGFCTASAFAKLTGYSYMHAYQLINGNVDVTLETVGRLVIVFGEECVKVIVDAVRESEGLVKFAPAPQKQTKG